LRQQRIGAVLTSRRLRLGAAPGQMRGGMRDDRRPVRATATATVTTSICASDIARIARVRCLLRAGTTPTTSGPSRPRATILWYGHHGCNAPFRGACFFFCACACVRVCVCACVRVCVCACVRVCDACVVWCSLPSRVRVRNTATMHCTVVHAALLALAQRRQDGRAAAARRTAATRRSPPAALVWTPPRIPPSPAMDTTRRWRVGMPRGVRRLSPTAKRRLLPAMLV
jgi:hypothetical protein